MIAAMISTEPWEAVKRTHPGGRRQCAKWAGHGFELSKYGTVGVALIDKTSNGEELRARAKLTTVVKLSTVSCFSHAHIPE